MAKRKKLLKMELLKHINRTKETSEKIIQTIEEVFETVVAPEPVKPVTEELPRMGPVVEEAVIKPKTSTRRKTSRTKKTTGV